MGEAIAGFGKFKAAKDRNKASKKAMGRTLEAIDEERSRLGGSFDALQDLNKDLSGAARMELSEGFNQARGFTNNAGNAALGQLEQGLSGEREALQGGFGRAGDFLGAAAGRERLIPKSMSGRIRDLGALDLSGFETSPGFEFRRDQGEGAISRLASARGGRLSGRTLQELSRFNQGLAAEEFDKFRDQRIAERGQDLSARGQDVSARSQDVTARGQDIQVGLENQRALDALASSQADLAAREGQAIGEAERVGRGAIAGTTLGMGQDQAKIAMTAGQALAGSAQSRLANALSTGTAMNQLSSGLLGATTGAIGLPLRTAGGTNQAIGQIGGELSVFGEGGLVSDAKGLI